MRFYLLISVFVFLIAGIWIADIAENWKIILSTVSVVVFVIIVVIGVSVIKVNLFFDSVCHVNATRNEIAITFDDGPNPVYTPQVLDVLASYNAKASFFCIGNKIEGNEDIIKRIHDEGHSIGNHTFEHHSSFPIWMPGRMVESVLKTDKEIERVIQQKTNMFRPPFGVVNNFIAMMIARLNKKSIGWSIRTKDTNHGPNDVILKVYKNLKPGSIVLLHDSHEYIVVELKSILEYCKIHGLNPVALKEA